jgi:hypothetical protein
MIWAHDAVGIDHTLMLLSDDPVIPISFKIQEHLFIKKFIKEN